MAVQKKQSVVPPSQGPLSTRTIDNQRKGNGYDRTGDNCKPNSQAKKTAVSACSRMAAAANGQNIDERLKAARERREEQQKALASRELSRIEREQRARRYFEQQLQQRKKKLLENRLKEERRRAAVEEKRKQRLKEEKERHESAVRRTQEKSQKAQQSPGQNSRGRKLAKNVSFHSMNTTITITPPKPQCSGSVPSRPTASPGPNHSQYRIINLAQYKSPRQQDTPKKNSNSVSNTRNASPSPNKSQQRCINLAQIKSPRKQDAPKNKKNSNSGSSTRSTAANTRVKPATVTKSRPSPPPSPERTPRRSISRHPTPLLLELPSVPEEDVSVCSAALSPGNSRPVRTSAEGRQENPPETPCSNLPENKTEARTTAAADRSPLQTPPPSTPGTPQVTSKPSGGTTDREEASRLLAEKRREARLQREREEQERLQREEEERRCREELERKRAEERARQQAEAQRLIEEKMRREEEEQRQAEEERAQAMREAALLQKQREEEQAKEREKAEQIKQEREIIAQKEEAARQARKKRLEEIMRRTRRTDSPDTKSAPVRTLPPLPNEAQPKENTHPVHNGTIEDAVKLPAVTKTSQLGLNNEEDMVPVVAFKERRSLRTLTGLDEIQTHQRAEVI